ncbi:MAG TPA: hypothetical protein VN964_09450 [Gemmatimonadales bacterium]|nr:hypothetical protein [Gemmatimonadales bacterium]
MRTLRIVLLVVSPALTGGASLAAAQSVERTDVPARGILRVTFDPRIMTWNDEFTDAGRRRLGFGLTGDTVGSRYIPALAQLEQNVRAVTGDLVPAIQPQLLGHGDRVALLPRFVASLGAGLLSVRQERRTYPITAELGVTSRLSVSLTVPIVRVATRSGLQLSTSGANLGLNPRLTVTGAEAAYLAFFTQFDTTLARLDQNIAAGLYGSCTPSCPARDSSAYWHGIYDALHHITYGVGQPGSPGSPFMPLDSSAAGRGIDSAVARIRRDMATFGVAGFDTTFLLPSDTLSSVLVQAAIVDSAIGFGYNRIPFRSGFRYGFGDVELGAKYRLLGGAHYAAALKALVRLPTGARDSADELLAQSIGDHQIDLEGQLTQELMAGPLWLNLAVRAAVQRPGTRVRRVAPPDAFLVPAAATASLRWDPGDYVAVDVAPLVRLAPEFAVGFTAGYWTKQRDRYAFQSPQDSVALATRLGAPIAASVLDEGTSQRRLRLGFAMTYHGATVEGGFSIEQTVSGVGGFVPAATVYRLVLRTSRKLF